MTTKAELLNMSDALRAKITELPDELFSFSDDFNRANENLEANANWTRVGGSAGNGQVSSNTARSNTTNATGAAFLGPDIGAASQFIRTKLLGDEMGSFACVRLTNPNNFIGMRYFAPNIDVYKRIAGTMTLVASAATARGDAQFELRYDAVAGTIRVMKDGVELIAPTAVGSLGTAPNDLPASNYAGMVMRLFAGSAFDDVTLGAL